jgi:hypothetical protein
MFTSFIVSGLVVHTPLGPRKSGMPESVLMPAPVSTAIFSEAATYAATPFDVGRRSIAHDRFSVVRYTFPTTGVRRIVRIGPTGNVVSVRPLILNLPTIVCAGE